MGEETLTEKELEQQMPRPTGYRLLIALPPAEKTTEGGIILASETAERERVASVVGQVIDMGPDAYMADDRFPNGAYCKVGDWIMMRAYVGTRFRFRGKEFRLINDDSVEAVVADPKGIQKV